MLETLPSGRALFYQMSICFKDDNDDPQGCGKLFPIMRFERQTFRLLSQSVLVFGLITKPNYQCACSLHDY